MDPYYPNSAWLCLRRDVFEELHRYKVRARNTDLGAGIGEHAGIGEGRRGAMINLGVVEKIADAVLYEGYLLYPYRQSAVKNRQRFNFGVLYPREYCEAQAGLGRLGNADRMPRVARRPGRHRSQGPFPAVGRARRAAGRPRAGGLDCPPASWNRLQSQPFQQRFRFEAADQAGRHSETLEGELELSVLALDDRLFRVTLTIRNLRAAGALPASGTATTCCCIPLFRFTAFFTPRAANFVSLLDPPEQFEAAAAGCRNAGAWPVLAGEEGQRDLVLSAPIILYDYPQIAPESPGDLFDGTEIDEILALRILTMTDAEKLEVRNGDDRARRILERTEMLPPEHFQKLHGALRGLRANRRDRDERVGMATAGGQAVARSLHGRRRRTSHRRPGPASSAPGRRHPGRRSGREDRRSSRASNRITRAACTWRS